jgi:tartronate-semialdehyde synthase
MNLEIRFARPIHWIVALWGGEVVPFKIENGILHIVMEDPSDLGSAFDKAKALAGEFKVPVVVEVILEKITNISMGVEINAVNEFEELAETSADAPTAILAMQA